MVATQIVAGTVTISTARASGIVLRTGRIGSNSVGIIPIVQARRRRNIVGVVPIM